MSLFCFAVLCFLSSFAIISLGKREVVALLLLCSECHMSLLSFFDLLAVPWFGLQYMIVAFPGHTHLHFYYTHVRMQRGGGTRGLDPQ